MALAVAAAVGASWLATAPLRRSDERVYTPDTDAYVSTAHPDANYGTRPTLRADATPKIRSYLRFRLPDLSGRVVSARLRLWSRSGDLTGYQVHRVASTSWDELSITSDNAPEAGEPVATSGPFGAGLWTSADVTRLVQGNEVSLALTSTSPQNVTFESREGPHKPQLVVKTAPAPPPTRPAPGPPLPAMVEDAVGATAARYGTRDDRGVPMHTLKIIPSPAGGYLGVYHAFAGGAAAVRVATSTDLLHWRQRAVLDRNASQPAIAALSDGGFVVAEEAHGTGRWLRFRYYPTLARLLRGAAARTFDAPRTLARGRGAEGTPNIYRATLAPDLAHSTIDVGFHYLKGGVVDRQARGTLTGFSRWRSRAEPELDASLERQGVAGHIGDRDHVSYQGAVYDLIEARAAADRPWRVWLHQPATHQARPLTIRTAKGSKAFANPTVTLLRAPSGAPAAVVTLFLPDSGAARGEAGELVYYKEYGPGPASPDPVIAAAGDVACRPGDPVTPTACHQQATSDLLVALQPTGVLALGDLQYERALGESFLRAYDPTWGRLKSVTHPVPGNHEDRTASEGYHRYFGPAAGDPKRGWYSFDIGAWHLIALNSNCRRAGGCGPGSPQERWLRTDLAAHPARCTLAFWHHPRFSSGRHAGDPDYDAFWRALHEAGADVVVNAHDHHYERFAPQDPRGRLDRARGIREFVVGTGGKSLEPFGRVRPNSEVRNNRTFGVLVLTLHRGGYDWRFVGERGTKFGDRGSGVCH
jgi:acid phosphatase type 7